jgi:hypothetical protein
LGAACCRGSVRGGAFGAGLGTESPRWGGLASGSDSDTLLSLFGCCSARCLVAIRPLALASLSSVFAARTSAGRLSDPWGGRATSAREPLVAGDGWADAVRGVESSLRCRGILERMRSAASSEYPHSTRRLRMWASDCRGTGQIRHLIGFIVTSLQEC